MAELVAVLSRGCQQGVNVALIRDGEPGQEGGTFQPPNQGLRTGNFTDIVAILNLFKERQKN